MDEETIKNIFEVGIGTIIGIIFILHFMANILRTISD